MATNKDYYIGLSFDEKENMYEWYKDYFMKHLAEYFMVDAGGRVREMSYAHRPDHDDLFAACKQHIDVSVLPSSKKEAPKHSWLNGKEDYTWEFRCALNTISDGLHARLVDRDRAFFNEGRDLMKKKNAEKIAESKIKSKGRGKEAALQRKKKEEAKLKEQELLKKQEQVAMNIPMDKFLDMITMKNYMREFMAFVDVEQLSDEALDKILKKDYLLAKRVENPSERLMIAAVKASNTGIRQFKNPSDKVKKLHKLLWKV